MQKNKPKEPEKISGADYRGGMMRVILEIPDSVFHLDLVAKVVNDDESTQIITTRMGLADIRQARRDFLELVPGGEI